MVPDPRDGSRPGLALERPACPVPRGPAHGQGVDPPALRLRARHLRRGGLAGRALVHRRWGEFPGDPAGQRPLRPDPAEGPRAPDPPRPAARLPAHRGRGRRRGFDRPPGSDAAGAAALREGGASGSGRGGRGRRDPASRRPAPRSFSRRTRRGIRRLPSPARGSALFRGGHPLHGPDRPRRRGRGDLRHRAAQRDPGRDEHPGRLPREDPGRPRPPRVPAGRGPEAQGGGRGPPGSVEGEEPGPVEEPRGDPPRPRRRPRRDRSRRRGGRDRGARVRVRRHVPREEDPRDGDRRRGAPDHRGPGRGFPAPRRATPGAERGRDDPDDARPT